jgi:metallo-beta-lactamase family protein
MDVRLKFLGGAGTVTGSKYLLEVDHRKILIDCGMFQGLKELRLLNWDVPPFDPQEIDAVILTHAHLDHTGYLPRLFKQGFNGPVYCTQGTSDLLELLLRDSAKLQEEEAEYAKKKGYSKHTNPLPLYSMEDAELVFPNVETVPFELLFPLDAGVALRFKMAGHILGAAMVEIVLTGSHQEKKILFSGDLGRDHDPIQYPPVHVEDADILLIESTYGDREAVVNDPQKELGEAINRGLDRGGCVMIPAFAVGRTQMMLYYINELMINGDIPKIPVYMDSPMAIAATKMYADNDNVHKIKKEELLSPDGFLTLRNQLRFVRSHEESVALNEVKSKAIIISASGMMTGGRILHHLYNRLPNSEDTLLIVGYQAEGTRGRRILEGEEEIRIFGQMVKVRCAVEFVDGLSAHADRAELIDWLSHFKDAPKMTFVVHGEKQASEALRQTIENDFGWNVKCPAYLDSEDLFQGI